jgi:teichuronic acid exporter
MSSATYVPDAVVVKSPGAISALRWSAIDAAGRRGVTFAVTIILARLLSPLEFGLVGMISIFTALASAIVDSGFGAALIQRNTITESDKSSVFYFNAAVGAVGGTMLFLSASPVAHFYRQPILLPMVRWMALNLFIESLGVAQVALLTRSLDFRSQFKAGFLALLVSGLVAVSMAASGWGVWSLVAQTVLSTTVFTATVWILCSWRPRTRFNPSSLRSLARFGSPLLCASFLNVVFDRVQMLIIGKAYSANQLGYYSRAFNTQQLPSSLLSTIVGRVMFPVFAQRSDDIHNLRRNVKSALAGLMLFTLPIMTALAITARPLVLVLFGEKWLPSVPYLQLLSVAGLCWPIHIINLNVTMAVGRTNLFLRLELVKKLLIALGVVCTFKISVIAMVWATVIVSVLSTTINSYYSERLIHYGFRKQIADLMPYLGASFLMACVRFTIIQTFHAPPVIQGLVAFIASASCYICCCAGFRLQAWKTIKELLIERSPGTTISPGLSCTDLVE